jgi:hypothetical protein
MSPLRDAAKNASASCDAALLIHLEARACLAHMGPCAGRKLTAGGGVTLDRLCNILEGEPEHVVQQEGRRSSGESRLQGQHQRQSHVLFDLLLNDGFGSQGPI